MNKLTFLLVALVGAVLLAGPAVVPSAPTTPPPPHKIALLDINRVLKEYKKVDALRVEMRGEISKSDQLRIGMKKQMDTIRGKIRSPNITSGSPKAVQLEQELLKIEAEASAFKKSERLRFLRLEAKRLKTIHNEIKAVVKQAADAWGYTVVLRFNGVNPSAQWHVGELQRSVIYHQADDDITDPVIHHLNTHYSPKVTRPTGALPTGGTTTPKR